MTINKERLEHIKFKVNSLRKRLHIKAYPIIMENLINQELSDKCILRYMELPESIDAVIEYHQKLKKYVIVVNVHKIKSHLMKRLNFSLAHEIGHCVLEHYKEYKDGISPNRVEELEEEANEFAGLFLVNEYKLMDRWRQKIAELSDYFFVSQEVVRIRKQSIRLHNRFDLSNKLIKFF